LTVRLIGSGKSSCQWLKRNSIILQLQQELNESDAVVITFQFSLGMAHEVLNPVDVLPLTGRKPVAMGDPVWRNPE
jgi:hypothetical protein